MTDTLQQARQSAQSAFDMLWQPGRAQRTPTRERASYWLSIHTGIKPALLTFDTLDEATCRKIAQACTAAHGPAAFQMGRR
jgi:hypothetical protein